MELINCNCHGNCQCQILSINCAGLYKRIVIARTYFTKIVIKKNEGSDVDEEYDSEECNLVGGYNDYKESD